jgi:hypothetical protein
MKIQKLFKRTGKKLRRLAKTARKHPWGTVALLGGGLASAEAGRRGYQLLKQRSGNGIRKPKRALKTNARRAERTVPAHATQH